MVNLEMGVADFALADLIADDQDLSYIDLHNARLDNLDFKGARLDHAIFDGSHLHDAHFDCIPRWGKSAEKYNSYNCSLLTTMNGASFKNVIYREAVYGSKYF